MIPAVIRVRNPFTGRMGTVVGTAGQARYVLVAWDGWLTLAEPWGGLEPVE